MDTPFEIRTLQFYANRIHELPDPNLSIAELEQVLQSKFILASDTDIYDYAFSVDMFLTYLNEVDLADADHKTKKLIDTTLKKIWVSTARGGQYGVIFASLAGIAMAGMLYYCFCSTWIFNIANMISVVVAVITSSTVMVAQDRAGLSRARRQWDAFADSLQRTMKQILMTEYGIPCIKILWRVFKRYPWRGFGVLLSSPLLYPIMFDKRVQAWWVDAKIIFQFSCMAMLDWFQLGPQQAVRMLVNATGVFYSKVKMMARLLFPVPSLSSANQFTYRPGFEYEDKVRLLLIKRRIPFATVQTEIIEVDNDLLHAPSYDAISHVWGSEQPSRSIMVNGCQFLVTSSVYNILYRCSSYFGPRLIWIDNICINQAKDAEVEKTAQIQKMRSIYDHARSVQVFFVDSLTGWLAVPFLSDLLMMYGSSKNDFADSMVSLLLRANLDRWVRARIDALLELLSNPWFERAWVVQEFVVAREISVHYNGFTFDWRKLVLFAEMLEDVDVPDAAHCLMSGGNKPCTELKTWIRRPILLDQWRKQLLFQRYFQLSDALSSFHGSKAIHWQDKIFAFIGFTDLTEDLSDIIDYTLSKDKILLTLANYFRRRESVLQTFPFAGLSALQTARTNLPTWVADWTMTQRITPIASSKYLHYNASKAEYDDVKDGASEREIIVRGFIIDQITDISMVDLDFTPDGGTIRSDPVTMITKALDYFVSAINLAKRRIVIFYSPLGVTVQRLEDAVCRTMFGDATWKSRPAGFEYRDLISRFIDHGTFIVNALEDGKFAMNDIHPLSWGMRAYKGEEWREPAIRTLFRQIDNVRWLCGDGRRFCVTRMRFIGMVPRVAVPGDLVCLLFGARVPMILRKCPSSEKYQLVGEAYVHGIMDGELEACNIARQDFTIV